VRYLEQLLLQHLLRLSYYVLRYLVEAADVDVLAAQVVDLLVLGLVRVA
jgi:hypothetical protein